MFLILNVYSEGSAVSTTVNIDNIFSAVDGGSVSIEEASYASTLVTFNDNVTTLQVVLPKSVFDFAIGGIDPNFDINGAPIS